MGIHTQESQLVDMCMVYNSDILVLVSVEVFDESHKNTQQLDNPHKMLIMLTLKLVQFFS
jgi:hypothetical protein